MTMHGSICYLFPTPDTQRCNIFHVSANKAFFVGEKSPIEKRDFVLALFLGSLQEEAIGPPQPPLKIYQNPYQAQRAHRHRPRLIPLQSMEK